MTRQEVHNIIRVTLELPEDFELLDETRPAFVPGWDSIGWMNILFSIEEELESEIPLEIFDESLNIGVFCDVVTTLQKSR